ncbi:UNVERIFIED_CONTAM: hypothetical protein Sindi_0642900 [Sesamum indicum]
MKKRAKLELDDKDFHDKIKANIKAKEDAVAQHEVLEQEIEGSYAESLGSSNCTIIRSGRRRI